MTAEGGDPPAGQLAAIFATRGMLRMGTHLSVSSAQELLLRICGSPERMVRVDSIISTCASVNDFLLAPSVRRSVDAAGRKVLLVLVPCVLSLCRLCLGLRPSLVSVVPGRLSQALLLPAYLATVEATIGDIFGRGSASFVKWQARLNAYANALGAATIYFAGRAKDPRMNILAASGMYAAMAAVTYFAVAETLPAARRARARAWVSPVEALAFFRRSPDLRRLAVLSALQHAGGGLRDGAGGGGGPPLYGAMHTAFRRKTFGWGMKQAADLRLLDQLAGIVQPMLTLPVQRAIGLKGTMYLATAVRGAEACNSLVTPSARTLFAHPAASLAVHGGTTLDRLLQRAAADVGAGPGELSAALAALCFPISITVPTLVATLFQWRARAPYAWLVGLNVATLAVQAAVLRQLGPLLARVDGTAAPPAGGRPGGAGPRLGTPRPRGPAESPTTLPTSPPRGPEESG